MTPLVSVVMAAKDYGRYIATAIDSVRAQSFAEWELIVVDDGSRDRTPAIVAPYLDDPRIRYLRADRLGQSRAKNLGIALSRGDFVAFLDADDVWEPDKLSRQLPLFRHDVDVVYSRRTLIDDAGLSRPAPAATLVRGDLRETLFVANPICFSSAVVRRTLFDRVGRFDDSIDLAIDYDFWLRAATVANFDYVDATLVQYRTGHANLSRQLDDRVPIACSIMERAAARGRASPAAVAEGFASTCRTLAYVLRRTKPRESLAWGVRALGWPHRRLLSLKTLAGTLLARVRPAVS
jgi:glycosyltransferase involved in cell wall biosynthesis